MHRPRDRLKDRDRNLIGRRICHEGMIHYLTALTVNGFRNIGNSMPAPAGDHPHRRFDAPGLVIQGATESFPLALDFGVLSLTTVILIVIAARLYPRLAQ